MGEDLRGPQTTARRLAREQARNQREHQADFLNSGKKLKDGAKIRKSRNSEKAGLGFAAAWDLHEGTPWIPPPEVQPGWVGVDTSETAERVVLLCGLLEAPK